MKLAFAYGLRWSVPGSDLRSMKLAFASLLSSLWFRFCLVVVSDPKHSATRPPTPDEDATDASELTLREIINIKLAESGEKEKLMELVRDRLVEPGWKDEMRIVCRF